MVFVKITCDMTDRAVAVEKFPVVAGDTSSFLPTVLQRMKAKCNDGRGGFSTPDADNSAFFAQFVIVEWMGRVHGDSGTMVVTGEHIKYRILFVFCLT